LNEQKGNNLIDAIKGRVDNREVQRVRKGDSERWEGK